MVERLVQEADAAIGEADTKKESAPLTTYVATTNSDEEHDSDKENHPEAKAVQWVLYKLEMPCCQEH